MVAGDDPEARDAYVVTTDDRPETLVEEWYDHVGLDPATLGVVAVGTPMRSTARSPSVREPATRNVIHGVADLEEAISVLTEWAREATRPVVFVDSLTSILDGTDRGDVVGFVDEIVALVGNGDGVAYFRIDPDRTDATTLALCTVLADAVIDVAGDGPVRRDVGWLGRSGVANPTTGMPIEDVFDVLAGHRRRLALHWLRRTDGPVAVVDLAERIVEFERRRDGHDPDVTLERTYAGLVHVDLPKLADANLIESGTDERTVASSPRISDLEPYLTVTEAVDLGG